MQSTTARIVLAVVLVAAAAILFIVLRDDDGDGGETSAGSDTERQATTTGADGDGEGNQQPPPPPPPPPIPTVAVRAGEPQGGVLTLEYTSGDRIRFRVRSDEAGEVHVHGYEKTEPVKAGGSVTLAFPADLQGGYEVELHSHSSGEFQIAELIVNPG